MHKRAGEHRRAIVLIGLPGSGKTTVGRLVAAELGADFLDVDHEIERRTGQSIAQLFALKGEARFRELEAEVVAARLAGAPAVVAPGGGWAAQPGALESLPDGAALVIYLETEPDVAALRVREAAGRPLVDGDVVPRMRALYADRAPAYARAEARVRTDGRSPAAVARDVVRLARIKGGW